MSRTGQMGVEFGGGVMERRHRAAAQLELAAGLERDASNGRQVAEANGVVAVVEIIPAGARLDALEQSVDAGFTLIGDGTERPDAEDMLFVLGADAPLGPWFAAARHRGDEIGARSDERRGFGAGHVDSQEAE